MVSSDKSHRPNAPPLDGLPDAIPLNVLFGNADKRMPRLSPDGDYYAYLADDAQGVTNVFVKPVQFEATDATAVAPQQITHERERPLWFFTWTRAPSTARHRILYVQDTAGDENFHLHVAEFALNADTHTVHDVRARDLTPFDGVTVMPHAITLSSEHPDTAVIALNKRDARVFDAYKVDLATGELALLLENPGDVNDWLVDKSLRVVAALANDPGNGATMLRVPTTEISTEPAAQWKMLAAWPHGEIATVHAVASDGKAVVVETSLFHKGDAAEDAATVGTNTSRLVLLSLEDGTEIRVLAHDGQCDVSSVTVSEESSRVRFATFKYTKPRVHVIDEAARADIERLVALCQGELLLVSASQGDQRWVVGDRRDDASLQYLLYDRTTQRHAALFETRPELAKYTLVPMEPHVIRTSDGEDMVAFLSLPHGVPPTKLPFVLYVHGGPWVRDEWGYDPVHQLFANRGYGCLSVNFRGSTGYGKRWTNLGDGQWGAAMQQDLTDAVHWLVQQGYADPARVAIYGSSYGGYATLAGLAFTPGLYACGVDIVGPSNLKTLLEATPAYWSVVKKMLTLRIGDVEHDEALNRRVSPLFHADKIQRPLLIAQGANDPRVKRAESDQIAKKLYENKRDVRYVVYADEGHGFDRAANRLDFTARVEQFLAAHLGGRALPLDDTLVAGNSAVEVDASAL